MVLFLYGCGASGPSAISLAQAKAALSQPMSADVCIHTEEITVEGHLERTGPELYSFAVTSPSQLEGLVLSLVQQELSLKYRGMELELETQVLPGEFALGTLNRVLDDLQRQEEVAFSNTQDGGGVLSGTVGEREFELVLDPQCRPRKFCLPQENIIIEWAEQTE